MSEFPACDRLNEVKDQTQAIHEFLEWLSDEKGVHLAKYMDGGGDFSMTTLGRHHRDNLMAEFHEVDLTEVEKEKQAILYRAQQQDAPKFQTRLIDFVEAKAFVRQFGIGASEAIENGRVSRNDGTAVTNPELMIETGDLIRLDNKLIGVVKHEDCEANRKKRRSRA